MLSVVKRAWGRVRGLDPRVLDGLLAVALSVAAGAQLLAVEPGNFRRLVPVVGTCLPLVLRRRYPLVGHALQVACAVLTQRQPVSASLLAIFIGVYSVAVYSRWRVPYLIWLVIGAAALGFEFPDSSPSMPAWALLLVGGFGVWLAGSAVRDHQLRGDMLEERALRLERERELSTRVALADERQRIARELHDVVAHSVSVMVVQTGAARTLLARAPDQAAIALQSVERSGREALGELRNLLGLLTEADAEPALAPQPGLGQLDRLVERVGQAGLQIDLQIGGTPRELPPGLDLTAYRILQEALTNALKYAGGARTQVKVEFGEHELTLEVLDAGVPLPNGNGQPATLGTSRAAESGRGLLGMQQRVAVYGGQLEAGRRPEGGFAVRARLPLQPV
ncbi:MAG TPA: histidine kinase [Chloroflexota bacterium]|nr:histidine kinase [Chloroflexota bacterium]